MPESQKLKAHTFKRPTLAAAMYTAIAAFCIASLTGCGEAPEVRTITSTDSTSRCLGETRSPECAVETLLACVTRIDGRMCEIALRGDESQLCHITEEERDVIDSTVCEWELLTDCERFGLVCGDDRPTNMLFYRIIATRTAPMGEVAQRFPRLASNGTVLEVDIDRWVCSDIENTALPFARPSSDIADQLTALWRRAQTVAWELKLSKQRPSPFVWYEAGADYCWKPYKYWVAPFGDSWILVQWTLEFIPHCETYDGCPEDNWPPYRLILDHPRREIE